MVDIGKRLGERYKILSVVGSGGMGVVYRARDERLDRDVAVKILPEHLAQNPSALARFEREAKALAALSHPNILTIYDFGTDSGNAYAVMELLKGETLRAHLSAKNLSCSKALPIAAAIAEGLAAAHSQGIIHRDLKPENIFLTTDGGIKILDFGLARMENPSASKDHTSAPTASVQTELGVVMGTVPYMSPEQARGLPLDARTDIFSFGCVFFEMLSGTRAFSGTNSMDIIASILKEEPPELSKITPGVPPQVVQTVFRCLKKNPEERFQSAKDLAFALRMSDSGQTVVPAAATLIERRRFPVKPLIWVLAAITILLAAAVAYRFIPARKEIGSLAVLPFANGSGDPDAEYLSDGITESLISSLSQVPDLKVMAHDTVFSYKGQRIDPRKVGHDLNVEAVVTGQVIQQGNTLVIRANLIKVADGSELWGDQYSRTLADIIAMQTDISKEISGKLRARLTGEEQKRVTKTYTQNSEAYQLVLKGDYYFWKFTLEDYEKAAGYFEEAIQKDPNYAVAYARLADAYAAPAFEGYVSPKEAFKNARKAAQKALDLDDSLGQAHLSRSGLYFNFDWNWPAAEKEIQLAIKLDPSRGEAHRIYSLILRSMGRWDEAISEMKTARELDPLSVVNARTLGITYYWAGQYDKAIEQYKKALDLDANRATVHDSLADAYARKGLHKEALDAEQRYLTLVGDEGSAAALAADFKKLGYRKARENLSRKTLELMIPAAEEQYISPMAFAVLYTDLGEKDKAFEWLEKSFEERNAWLPFLKADPQFESLRSDPRFKDLVRRIGIP
jgi:serine/threonine protein kinase/tetratricopeptide (TPR) repeat protein